MGRTEDFTQNIFFLIQTVRKLRTKGKNNTIVANCLLAGASTALPPLVLESMFIEVSPDCDRDGERVPREPES